MKYVDETNLKSFKSHNASVPELPSFVAMEIDKEKLKKIFGSVECESGISEKLNGDVHTTCHDSEDRSCGKKDPKSSEHNAKATDVEKVEVKENTNNSSRKDEMEKPSEEIKVNKSTDLPQEKFKASNESTEIISKFVHRTKVDHIAVISETSAWIAGSGYLELVRYDGHVEQSIKTDFSVRGMAITKTGELILGTEGAIKKLMPGGQIIDFVNVGKFNANGIFVTQNNEILVCLYRDDVGELIIRLSSQGKTIQKIKHDKNDFPLFMWPWYIIENNNGDIWVSDYTEECIVVISKKLEPRFKYNGPTHIKMNKQFYPRGMITNKNGQIVVIDRGNEAVHLLDKDGRFVDFILTKDDGIIGPYSLSQDNKGTIWVGCASRRIVMVAKYLK